MMSVRFINFIYGLGGNQQNARKCFRLTLHLQKQSPPRLCLLCPAPLRPVNSAHINRLIQSTLGFATSLRTVGQSAMSLWGGIFSVNPPY